MSLYPRTVVGSEYDQSIEMKYLPFSITKALDALKNDFEFLTRDDIFSEPFIKHWIKLKSDEFNQISNWPSPAEYSFYFDI